MAYRIKSSFLEASLFEDAVEGARCDIVAGLACNSNPTGFGEVLKLSVTSLCRDKIPPVIMQHPHHLTNFHRANIPMGEDGAKQDALLLLQRFQLRAIRTFENFKLAGGKATIEGVR